MEYAPGAAGASLGSTMTRAEHVIATPGNNHADSMLYRLDQQERTAMDPNPNQAMWEKGDFTRIAAAMRESGDAFVDGLGITPGMKVLDLGCGDGTTALPAARRGADVLGVDIARNLVDAGNARARAEGLTNASFRAGRCHQPERARRSQLRPGGQRLRCDVRAEAVRRGEGDGARHQARRPDRDGQLDSQRPDARRAASEDQLRLFAPAARGLRQPDDLGHREPRDRAIRGRGDSRRPDCIRQGHVRLSLSAADRLRMSGTSGTTTGRR